jgi:hypothetical protein
MLDGPMHRAYLALSTRSTNEPFSIEHRIKRLAVHDIEPIPVEQFRKEIHDGDA